MVTCSDDVRAGGVIAAVVVLVGMAAAAPFAVVSMVRSTGIYVRLRIRMARNNSTSIHSLPRTFWCCMPGSIHPQTS